MASESTSQATSSVERQPLDLRTLRIIRVIAHQIYQKDAQGDPVAPLLSKNLSKLPPEALTELEDRITKALGENAASLPINFNDLENNTFYKNAAIALTAASDEAFRDATHEVALKLADAQIPRNPPGGILLILQATLMRGTMPVVFVIKAESQSGFGRKDKEDQVEIEVIKELFLTRRQAVYKVAALARSIRKSDEDIGTADIGWLFDSSLTRRQERVQPADYFLRAFLQASISQTGATDTADFYRAVSTFANEGDLGDQQKVELMANLNTFLSRPEIAVFTLEEFRDTSVAEALQPAFTEHMESMVVPRHGILKDTTHINNVIKKNALEFTSKVRIHYPTDVEAVTVLEETPDGTTVRIAGRLTKVK